MTEARIVKFLTQVGHI